MDVKKIVAIVEDAEVARIALNWALHNLVRHGDLITLLHVFPYSRSRSRNKLRIRRLKGFQLALSFKDICTNFPNVALTVSLQHTILWDFTDARFFAVFLISFRPRSHTDSVQTLLQSYGDQGRQGREGILESELK
ncbi:hypothetical protein RHMOL_Rhmol09G0064700 [Rhododendron molle]|uniref:Uncharacterized protein n=1 Tax=Rhododendron molle TaxID=49168 RepID=A0ACC0MBU0_RHOML|nr:hypothetical protein RHMOL_Rhmol09G0064700 [Rhododendron molle]